MSFTSFNTAILSLTALTGFAVLAHDTQADKAAMTSLGAPNILVAGAAPSRADTEALKGSEDHIHTENMTDDLRRMTTSEPRLQTRNAEDKKYVSIKKMMINTANGLDI